MSFGDQHWRSWNRLKSPVATIGAFLAGGLVYPLVFSRVEWHVFLLATSSAFLIGVAGSFAEAFYFQRRGRRLQFSVILAARTVFYILLVNICVIGSNIVHRMFLHDFTLEASVADTMDMYINGDETLRINAYALTMIFAINFIRQINRLLGQNALLNFILGRYHHAVEEERVFMFLDLKSSTAIAEKLGHSRYHEFLNDFFYDITPPIVENKGEIYQYVGDEVVVTWKKRHGVEEANCIKCYFQIVATMQLLGDRYRDRYGCVPEFKAGFHLGKVIAGIIGDIKRDIVFHGDTVNTASRIRSECSVLGKNMLLSGELLRMIEIDEVLTPESIGRIKLRGKEEEIELFSIREAA